MSVTTTDNARRLTRSQHAQMPALLEFYSPSAALMEARQQGAARGVIWWVASMFVAGTVAAALIPIDKVVSAAGRVVAKESTIVIQPLETSILRHVYVQEGQVVHKGELLAQLDPTFTNSDKTAMTASVASLQSEVDRLTAEAAGTDYKPKATDPSSMVQEVLFTQRRAEHAFKTENYKQKMDALQAMLGKAIGDVQTYTERLTVASTVESKRDELQRLGWGSQLNSLQSKDSRLDIQQRLQNAQQSAKSAAGDLQAMRAEAAGYEQDWKSKINQDLTDQNRKLSEAVSNLQKADLRSNLVDVRAEADSTVLTKARVSDGSVLQSGDQLLTLVPLNAPLELEASVSGSDAGYVHDGDKVTVKFDTFPFTQYGGADGTVRTLSPDSFTNQQDDRTRSGLGATQNGAAGGGTSFYRMRISLDKVSLHDTPAGFKLTPGMPVTADVMVGKRTILNYIFGRALPVATEGMREP